MSENEMNSEQPIVSLKDVHKSFGDLEVLKGISFDVKKGEVICICLLYTSDAADD